MFKVPSLFSLIFLSLFPALAVSAPFGIEMGMPITELKTIGKAKKFRVDIKPPKPHPKLTTYEVGHTKKTGVCFINAFSDKITNDKYGKKVRNLVTELRTQLESKYGEFMEFYMASENTIWDDSDEWMMSIKQGERQHFIQIFAPTVSIKTIEVKVAAFSQDSGAVRVRYEFQNINKCEKVHQKEASSSL